MRITGVILALALAMTSSLAGAQVLPPGKPAGVAGAQMNNHQLFIYITVGGALATIAATLLLTKKSSPSSTVAPAAAAPAVIAPAAVATTTT